jgi:hypothetical protein
MLMKYKDFKILSNGDLKKIMGGMSTSAGSDCSMKCANGKDISITGCDGDCGCSELLQGCACVYNGGTQCTSLCSDED